MFYASETDLIFFIHFNLSSSIHSFIHSFTNSFTHSFIHSFIHPFIQCVWTEVWGSPSSICVPSTELKSWGLVQAPTNAETSHWFQDWLFKILFRSEIIQYLLSTIAPLTQITTFWRLFYILVCLYTIYAFCIYHLMSVSSVLYQAHQVRVLLSSFPRSLGPIPSNHTVAHNHL